MPKLPSNGTNKTLTLTHNVCDFLYLRNWHTIPINTEQQLDTGMSNLIAIKNGITIWLSVKACDEPQHPIELEFESYISNNNGIYKIIRTRDDLITLDSILSFNNKLFDTTRCGLKVCTLPSSCLI